MSEETTSKSTPDLTPVSAFMPPTILFAGIAQGMHMVKNSIEQSLVLSNIWSPPKQVRIGAFAATFRFPPGSVGSGTSGAIQAIHSVFGSFGEARIGNYFNLPMVQQFLAKPIGNIGANTLVASGEYRYWCKILAVSYMRFLGDLKTFKLNFPALQTLAGGVAGASASVPFRVAIAQGLTSSGGLLRGFQPRSIAMGTGAIGTSMIVVCVKKLFTYEGPADPGEDAHARIEVVD